jgi:hypothetical protein
MCIYFERQATRKEKIENKPIIEFSKAFSYINLRSFFGFSVKYR